jgi:aminoglycoside 3-N-acetyltransferase
LTVRAVRDILDGRVPRDGVLTVHSGFRALGRAGYKAEAFIETLLGHLSAGTLVMPTMSWRTVTPEHPVFDELATPSHVGIVPELFRTRYASARSLHPTHSVAAAGQLAATLTATHHLGNTPCAMNSPYGLMRDYPSYLLMLGCGFERCTAIHLPEELIAPDLYLLPLEEAESYELRDRHGGRHGMRLRRHRRLNRCFEKFEPMLAERGLLLQGEIAGTRFLLCSLAELLDQVFSEFERDREATLAPAGLRTRLSG